MLQHPEVTAPTLKRLLNTPVGRCWTLRDAAKRLERARVRAWLSPGCRPLFLQASAPAPPCPSHEVNNFG